MGRDGRAGGGEAVKQFVAFSGGWDSTALALLVPDATPVFTDTGDEFPELYAHLDRFERVTGRKVERVCRAERLDLQSPPGGSLLVKQTLPEYIHQKRFLPNHGARFCTRMFKIEPLNSFLADRLPAELLIGLRADEPERTGNLTDMDGLAIRYPLREMGYTRADVMRVCLEHDLLTRYPPYMARGGCKGCYYKRKSEVQAMIVMVPEIADELQVREEAVQDERGSYFHMFPNCGMSIREMRLQPQMPELERLYHEAAQDEDKGQACGLFCHR